MIKKKKLILMGILAIAVALVMGLTSLPGIAEDENYEVEGCTGIIVTGRAAWDGKTINGENSDTYPRPSITKSIRVNEETGIKVIDRLNDQGVCLAGLAKPSMPGNYTIGWDWADKDEGYFLEYAYWKADYPELKLPGTKYVLEHARSAKEAVEMYTSVLPEGTYEIIPVKNAAIASSNFFLSPSGLLQPFNIDKEYSENRAEIAQELLDQRSWLKSTTARGEITIAYVFRIFRDHQFGYDPGATFGHDNTGNISRWGNVKRTRVTRISEISQDYTDLLSIWWETPNFSPTSPFLPFYIGITEIPKTFADGPTNESGVFQELFNAVSYNLECLDEVQAFWESFEHNILRDRVRLEKVVKKLVDAGDREEAERLLTEFSNEKCELAVAYAKELTKEIVSRGLVKVDISVFPY